MDIERPEPLAEKGTFFAKLDQLHSVQDYAPFGPCMRLIGISADSFSQDLFNSPQGCWTFLIDLGWSDLSGVSYAWSWLVRSNFYGGSPFEWDNEVANQWVGIDYQVSLQPTGSYAYALFTDLEPQYLSVGEIKFYQGSAIKPFLASNPTITQSSTGAETTLTAFHVGQGMCSLMSDGTTGYLLDAGAGTPVRRPDYQGAAIKNELLPAIANVSTLSAIISHPDSDHWRLLDWDSTLRNQVQAVYLPDAAPALAFSSPAIKHKVVAMKDAVLKLGGSSELRVYRSDPSVSDRNGECLVACAEVGNKRALLAGDYVYSRMLSDRRTDSAIHQLGSGTFDAVVVPHHGDAASALCLAGPKDKDKSVAFFSAGTHAGYNHPTTPSLDNHQRRGFAIVDQHWLKDIRARQLLP